MSSATRPIVLKLQADALNPEVPVSNLLRQAKAIATKLDLQDALVWIDRELNDYTDVPSKGLPPYRRLSGTPQALTPYHGWQAIQFNDPELERVVSQAPICEAIGSLEKQLSASGRAKEGWSFQFPPENKARLMEAISPSLDARIELQYGALWNIIEQVRNLVLNWTLELEKAGVLGEDMTFTDKEKQEAGPLTHQYFNIQNVGVLGNVSGQATVTNKQHAEITLNVDQVRNFTTQARAALPLLPDAVRSELEPILEGVENELDASKPSQSKLHKFLTSMRTICEGAAGNLAASGILTLLKGISG